MFDDLTMPLKFLAAFLIVLALIGAAAWLVRRFGGTRLDAAARGRQPRLAVIDSAAVDGRRKLVIIRRDNVEHLLMIGGPSDVVVETSIVRSTPAASRDVAAARASEPMPRTMPLADPTPWPLQPEPAPVQPARADRGPSLGEDEQPWPEPAGAALPAPEVRPVRPADTLAGLAEELARPEQILPRGAQLQPQPGPMPMPPRPATPSAPSAALSPPSQISAAADQSLAEMAQRLEAALRRPTAQRVVAETARVTATVEVKAGPPKPPVQPRNTAQSKPQSGNLEQEMANLLSRPGKT